MEKILGTIGKLLFGLRFVMSAFYAGLVLVMVAILVKFVKEVYQLIFPSTDAVMEKMELIIKVLELVDMTMVAQLVWVVALAGFSLFVTSSHFDDPQDINTSSNHKQLKKPDWLDHVNTYNLKLKLAFAMISISGVHALKVYLQGAHSIEHILMVTLAHFVFVISAIGIAFAEYLARKEVKV